ncbi:MAG: hypothetical protein A3C51_03160 [Omnitrophica bacterium RIFCSPHIGHO2_02_FULL_46_20]|nr:MAG: hypothetical protein A3C51_03160 [Omnitrophica bacterium RIFCSPHIGHO2_02_FULL_46_20]
MFIYKNGYSILFKTIAIVLACLFLVYDVSLSLDLKNSSVTSTLAPIAGNPEVYQEMRSMMEERLAAHQEPIDEVIKEHSNKAKNLSSIPHLEEEFIGLINACNADNMLARLKTTLASAGGRIQVIFVKNENELPVFEGKKIWGHAGAYITAFALEGEKDSKEGRGKIIARLFHEIRARSTRAKELFDEEFENKNPDTPEEISAFIRSMRERFEKGNLQIQQEIEQNNLITSPALVREFTDLAFAIHPDIINRDYMTAKDVSPERPRESASGTPVSAEELDWKVICKMSGTIICELAYEKSQHNLTKAAKLIDIGYQHVKDIKNRSYSNPFYETAKAALVKILSPLMDDKNHSGEIYKKSMHTVRRSLALLALEETNDNKVAAAHLLRISNISIERSLWVEILPEPYESQVRKFLAESAIPVLLQQLKQPPRERKQVQNTVVIEQLNYHEIVKMARTAICELAYEDKQSRSEDAAKALGIGPVYVRGGLIRYRYVHAHPLYHTMKKSLGSTLSPLLKNKPPLPSLYDLTINTIERSLVILALEYTHGNGSAASRLLQLAQSGMRNTARFKLLPEPYLGQVKKFVAEEIFPALIKEYNNPPPRPKRRFAAMPSIAEKPSDIELYTWQGLVRLATSAMSHVVYEDLAGKNITKAASLIGCAELNLRYHLSYASDSFLFNALRTQMGDIVNRFVGRKRFLFDIRWAIRRVCAEAALTIADGKQDNAARLLKTSAKVINSAMQKKQNDEMYRLLKDAVGSTISFAILRKNTVEKVIEIADNKLMQKNDIELQQLARQLKREAGKGVAPNKILPYAFALFYEAARRTAGLEPAREQVMAALALHYGFAVEMLPSEGKTLAIAMAAYLNALYARGVHIHTFNDFLARRDCQDMGGIFAFLGMTTATLVDYSTSYQYQQMPYRSAKVYPDTPNLIRAKKDKAYQCDITYGPRDEFIFDFLRDNMVPSPEHRVQRAAAPGLIIVDEADNCMIDEAYNPMIVGKPGIGIGVESYRKIYEIVSRLAQQNEKNRYYAVDYLNQLILINPDARADEVFDAMSKDSLRTNLFWRQAPKSGRLNLLTSALSAIHFYHKDEDYVVRDGKIIIVDEFTGRLKPSHMWANHITQFVQAREGLKIYPSLAPIGIITYQNYYRMMKERTKLAVTSGTIGTTAEEFSKVYDLATMCIPLQWSSLRIDRQPEMLPDDEKQAARVIERVKEIHRKGNPVLVFTPTIRKAHNLRGLLQQNAGINAATLDGLDTSEEFSIIARAGKKGDVTIATNTVGRGVHIRTDDEVDSLGGLCVILTAQNRDGRIDEQQRTRTARRGRKGWTETILSLENGLYKRFGEKDPQLVSEELYRAMRQKTFDLDILLDKKRREFYTAREYLLQSAIDQTRKRELLNLMDSEWSRFLTRLERIRYVAANEEYRQLCETGFNAVKMKIWEMVPGARAGTLLNVKETMEEVRKILPREWYENDFKSAEFFAELARLLQIENILDQDKSTFIFSEKVTFDNGIGVLLPKLAKSGMRVAVIATNGRQRALIDELNQDNPENGRIIYGETIADIRTKVHTARYYYFKVKGDPDTDLQGITTFDITEIVKKIIDALGKVSGIIERERLELLRQAAQKFAQAA